MKRIGVSGSNGKSTTALWTVAAIDTDETPVACVWSDGDTFHGQPVQVEHSMPGFLRFDASAERAGAAAMVVEITSRALAFGFAERWPCDVVVLTNITHEHHDDHGSQGAYLRAKARLFDALRPGGIAVFTATDRLTAELAQKARPDIQRRGYRLADRTPFAPASFTASIQDMSWGRTEMLVETKGDGPSCFSLTAPAPGEHFAENALAAWIAAISAGIDPQQAAAGITSASPPPARFEIVARSPTVVADYGHTPDALERTVATACRLTPGKVILVFGAHGWMDRPKRLAMGAAASEAHEIVLTSHDPHEADPAEIAREVQEGMSPAGRARSRIIADRREAIIDAILRADRDDTVLITGRGDELVQMVGDQEIPLVDGEVARDALRLRSPLG